MLRIIHAAPRFAAAPHERTRFSPPTWPAAFWIWMMWEAMYEGLAAHRHYEQLRSKGIAHNAALRQALAMGPACAQPAQGAIAPLYFAGRA
jgi:hypothetical protein